MRTFVGVAAVVAAIALASCGGTDGTTATTHQHRENNPVNCASRRPVLLALRPDPERAPKRLPGPFRTASRASPARSRAVSPINSSWKPKPLPGLARAGRICAARRIS